METKRVNLNDGTRRADQGGDTRRVEPQPSLKGEGTPLDSDATKKAGNDPTKKAVDDGTKKSGQGAGGGSGPAGVNIFGTGQPLELNGKNCTVENIISMSSSEAVVYKITMDGKHYVLKHYKTEAPLTDDAVKVLEKIKGNPKNNVIHLYDFGKLGDQDFELMELAEGGTLNHYIRSLGAVKDPHKLRAVVKMIIDGLMQMHGEYRVIHQDIKPDNIYFRDAQKASLILADFGISSVMGSGEETKVLASCTPLYAAPELAPDGDSVYVNVTPSVDYFALGITMLELWLGEKPFKGIPEAKRDDMILKEQTQFPADMPEDTKIIIQGLIKPDKKDRWGKIELDKWLKGEKLEPGQKAARFIYEPIKVGSETASNPEELAVLFTKYPDNAMALLYGGEIIAWLEKSGDKKLLGEIQKLIKKYANEKAVGCYTAMYTLNPGHPFTSKGGKVCKNSEEIAAALLAESSYYTEELKKPNTAFYLYLSIAEGAHGKKAAYDFCEYFKKEDYSPKRALNHVYLKLQEEGRITIGKKKYYKGEEMAQEKDASQIALIKKALNETDSLLMVWLSDMYPDYLEETDGFTELPPWSQFFITGLLPFLSYKELIPDWKERSMFDLRFLLAEMPGRADVFEAYAKQGLPLTGHLPDDRGSTPLDFLIFNYIKLMKEHGEGTVLNLIRLLIKLGADLNEKSKDGKGPRTNVFNTYANNLIKLLKEFAPDIEESSGDALDMTSDIQERLLILWNAGRYEEAFKLRLPLAEKGEAASQMIIGSHYRDGKGVKQDYAEAVKWFLKSAQQGLKESQYELGTFYILGMGVEKDQPKGAEYFRKAAEQGHLEAQNMMGTCYKEGYGVDEDPVKAFEWYKKAAERTDKFAFHNEGAMFDLGDCYYNGIGVEQNDGKAFEWFLKAAERGHAKSQAMLGDCYSEGNGVKQDKAKAIEWYKKAAAQGHEGAKEMLLLESGFTGKNKQTFEDGSVYEGDYLNGKRTGKGKLLFTNGFIYEGDFLNDSLHGKGKLTAPDGNVGYEGDFADDRKNGKGKMTYNNGCIYEGDFVDDKRNGKGKMTYPDGRVEDGNWKDGKFIG